MKLAIHGLGRMGMQIARKLSEDGHQVIAHNRSPDKIETAVGFGAIAALTKQEVLDQFKGEQAVVWMMLPAETVEEELNAWLAVLPSGSLLIDGGNSDFRLTKIHAEMVSSHGSMLVDVGVSGGVWGYQHGFSMMAGGSEDGFKNIEPAFKTLALPEGAYHYFGPAGAGHFVKMVHNAIEYGMMESLAEGYRMLKEGPYKSLDLGAAGDIWQHHSVITSWLNELCRDALSENPGLEGIEGYVAESGEARWTLEAAEKLGIPLPSIQAAFNVRLASQKGEVSFATKLLSAMRNKFGGHELNKEQ
ncbi:MAG TPA: NADP-dependent phosphogluconate dehydrogenase [Candidatus Saccharimonadales bacterium]|nr:NADP-dependent phosphogluconate dehydrogenase [Candidatus Saccharimonadales bacterium]